MIIKLEAEVNVLPARSRLPDKVAIFTAVSSVRPPLVKKGLEDLLNLYAFAKQGRKRP